MNETRTKETEAQTYRHRIPADSFEVELYERVIREHLRTWPAYNRTISYDGKGIWTLAVCPKDLDMFDFNRWVMGKIWLAEAAYGEPGYYSVAVIWEIRGLWNVNTPPHLDLINGEE